MSLSESAAFSAFWERALLATLSDSQHVERVARAQLVLSLLTFPLGFDRRRLRCGCDTLTLGVQVPNTEQHRSTQHLELPVFICCRRPVATHLFPTLSFPHPPSGERRLVRGLYAQAPSHPAQGVEVPPLRQGCCTLPTPPLALSSPSPLSISSSCTSSTPWVEPHTPSRGCGGRGVEV